MGYQNIDTDGVGNVMICPTFLNVGKEGKCCLSDLKVTGYTLPKDNGKGGYTGGCTGGKFVMMKLNGNGIAEASYHWLDTGKIGPGWFSTSAGAAIDGGAESVQIPAGQGFWTSGGGLKLVPAGAVNEKDVAYATDGVGNVVVGNPSPVEITLNDLTVSGYALPKDNGKGGYTGGCTGGKFVMMKLNGNGIAEASYHWLDTGKIGPGWFSTSAGAAIEGGAESVKIFPGQSFWTSGGGLTVTFPGVDLKKEE